MAYYPVDTHYCEVPPEFALMTRTIVLSDDNIEDYDGLGNLKHIPAPYEFDDLGGTKVWDYMGHADDMMQFGDIKQVLADYLIVKTRRGNLLRIAFHRARGSCNPVGAIDVHPNRLKTKAERIAHSALGVHAMKLHREERQKQLKEIALGKRKAIKEKWTNKRKLMALKAIETTGNLRSAAVALNITEQDVVDFINKNQIFAQNVAKAKQKFVDTMEKRAIQLATGVDRAIYYKGKVIGVQNEVSEKMLLKVLSIHDPKWSDKQQVDVNVNVKEIDAADSAKTKLASMLGLEASKMISHMTGEDVLEQEIEDIDYIEVDEEQED